MANLKNTIKGDKIIWLIIGLLILISLIAVYSSSSQLAHREQQSEFFIMLKQGGFVLVGLFMLVLCHRIPLKIYRLLTVPCFIACFLLVAYSLKFGNTLNDGTRWVNLGFVSFQPSEFAKITLILYIAKMVELGKAENFKHFLLWIVLPTGVCLGLLLWGSISMSVIVGLTVLLLLFVAQVRPKYLLQMMGIATGIGAIVIVLALTTPAFPRMETGLSRITTFLQKEDDRPLSEEEQEAKEAKEFQSKHAKIAVASGGIIGKLPGNSTQRYVLPHPYSDFIFAVIVEETGIVGALIVIFLYLCLFYRIIVVAKGCTTHYTSLTVCGLGMLIVVQAIIHMAVNVGIIPVTGQTLPLISLGGSSILATSIAFGIILCVSRTVNRQKQEEMEATASLKSSMENE